MVIELESRLAGREAEDSQSMGALQREVLDLRQLCGSLQERNLGNLREIEYLKDRAERGASNSKRSSSRLGKFGSYSGLDKFDRVVDNRLDR